MEIKQFEEQNEYEAELGKVLYKLARVFSNEAGFRNAIKYLRGLLGTAERKNGWQMSEYLGETTPYALQQFLYRGKFSADEARDVLR